ncbi:hypothetical protein ACIPYQ_30295 [Streptomyces sp. NPDC090045]|uniref:hypothetical protein n=1 Tax=Streptomyces sp. NPDC090045 TaxID=3365927 RepID=UPI00382DF4D2
MGLLQRLLHGEFGLTFPQESSSFFYEGERSLTAEEFDAPFRQGLPTLARAASRTLDWSSGSIEGAVNRIKKIKRQLYGRAGRASPSTARLPATTSATDRRSGGGSGGGGGRAGPMAGLGP